jgi:hypothetical protein
MKTTVFWKIAPCIALMMEAVSTSETVVNFYKTTWCNIPVASYLHTHCCENWNLTSVKFLTSSLSPYMKVYPKFPGIAATTKNGKKYTFLPVGATVSLSSESV